MDIELNKGYFLLAKNISKYSDHRVKVGAVIARKKPISAASNKIGSHPRYANPEDSNRLSIHAEIRAIINSGCYDLEGSEIWVYRQHKNGETALSRPCSFCLSILRERGIRKIHYTIETYPFYKTEKL